MPWGRLTALAIAVFLTRAPFVPPTLEDYDSVNFALSLEDFDPLAHQPHPPGYPVFVALARVLYALVPNPSLALGLLSAISQALAVFPAFAVFSFLLPDRRLAWVASLLLFTCPVLWFNGARPLSDSSGLLFALAAQALLLRHLETGRGLVAGSLVSALAVGVRLQTVLLTAPLWVLAAARRGPRLKGAAALLVGAAVWLGPLLMLSGGPSRYMAAFGETMGMALDIEPLFTRFSLNLAARAAGFVLVAPWITPLLAGAVLGFALLGTWQMGARHPKHLALGLISFGPYLLAHTLFHQVEAVRYALPYLPLPSLLAAAGVAWLVERAGVRETARAEVALTALLCVGSAALTLPALWVFSTVESPPAAAVNVVRAIAEGRRGGLARGPGPPVAAQDGAPRDGVPARHDFVLASHYTLQRYLGALPESLELLATGPNDAVARLSQYWLEGGEKDALFLADPRRTDLASIDPRAMRSIGRWTWPLHVDRFMPGARPARAELLRIAPPAWMAGPGWLLSLEAGRPEAVATLPERVAYLRSLEAPSFLLLAGEPAGDAAGCTLVVDRNGEPLDTFPCTEPFLRGVKLPPPEHGGYANLRIRPRRASGSGMPSVLLRGLDYGPAEASGWAHGAGWHYPERDEQGYRFRWTSGRATSLVHVPEEGAWLRVEGTAPVAYVGMGGSVRLLADGSELARGVIGEATFRLEAQLPGGSEAFREVSVVVDRTFVPHDLQRSGDQRQLGVRIYRFELYSPRSGHRWLAEPSTGATEQGGGSS